MRAEEDFNSAFLSRSAIRLCLRTRPVPTPHAAHPPRPSTCTGENSDRPSSHAPEGRPATPCPPPCPLRPPIPLPRSTHVQMEAPTRPLRGGCAPSAVCRRAARQLQACSKIHPRRRAARARPRRPSPRSRRGSAQLRFTLGRLRCVIADSPISFECCAKRTWHMSHGGEAFFSQCTRIV